MFDRSAEMSFGEQAALLGILERLKPRTAVEIGTYTGGSLRILASKCDHVHTLDLVCHCARDLENVTYHLGDSSSKLPALLRQLEDTHSSVDFFLVDGDHSRRGVHRDALSILRSPVAANSVVVFHDTANEAVRSGIRDAIEGLELSYIDLSFVVPSRTSSLLGEAWGGLGVIAVGGPVWSLSPDRRPNVAWATTTRRGLIWNLLGPVRSTKRDFAYRLRPAIRRWRGVRGNDGT